MSSNTSSSHRGPSPSLRTDTFTCVRCGLVVSTLAPDSSRRNHLPELPEFAAHPRPGRWRPVRLRGAHGSALDRRVARRRVGCGAPMHRLSRTGAAPGVRRRQPADLDAHRRSAAGRATVPTRNIRGSVRRASCHEGNSSGAARNVPKRYCTGSVANPAIFSAASAVEGRSRCVRPGPRIAITVRTVWPVGMSISECRVTAPPHVAGEWQR